MADQVCCNLKVEKAGSESSGWVAFYGSTGQVSSYIRADSPLKVVPDPGLSSITLIENGRYCTLVLSAEKAQFNYYESYDMPLTEELDTRDFIVGCKAYLIGASLMSQDTSIPSQPKFIFVDGEQDYILEFLRDGNLKLVRMSNEA